MKINELRINNYYELKGSVLGGGVCQLKNLNDFIHIGNLIESDLVKPIPLTKELYRKVEKQLIKKGFSYGFEKGKLTLYLSDEWEFESEFLHQLQNLYFALTNEELTIK